MKSEIGKNALTSFLATPTYTILTVIKFCEKLVNLLKQLFLVLWSFLIFLYTNIMNGSIEYYSTFRFIAGATNGESQPAIH